MHNFFFFQYVSFGKCCQILTQNDAPLRISIPASPQKGGELAITSPQKAGNLRLFHVKKRGNLQTSPHNKRGRFRAPFVQSSSSSQNGMLSCCGILNLIIRPTFCPFFPSARFNDTFFVFLPLSAYSKFSRLRYAMNIS